MIISWKNELIKNKMILELNTPIETFEPSPLLKLYAERLKEMVKDKSFRRLLNLIH